MPKYSSNSKKSINDLLVRKAIKDLSYNIHEGRFFFNVKLDNKDREELKMRCRELGVNWKEFELSINETLSSFQLHQEQKKVVDNIFVEDFSNGTQILLTHKVQYQTNMERLLKVASNKFLLLGHDKKNLLLGDVLISNTHPWNTGGRINFKVYRNGRRYIQGIREIYQTGAIQSIQLILEPYIYKLYDQTKKE